MSRPTPLACKTRNWPAYNSALKRRDSLTIWFDPAMTWEAAPTGKRGRQPDYGDAPMLPELLDQIPPEQEIATATADGAFDTRKCHAYIAARGAAAIIPPSKNARPWKPDTPVAIARNEILRTSKRVGRTTWRRWSGYHRRSRVETKMHCAKLLGQRLPARDFDRQVAEFQVRDAVLNGFTALGFPVTEVVG